MFSVVGATGLVGRGLDPTDLTVALVLDDGPGVAAETVITQQGSALELVRNLPDGVEVMFCTTSGLVASATADRQAAMMAISGSPSRVDPADALGPAVVAAATGLEAAADGRRQLIVLTDETSDVTVPRPPRSPNRSTGQRAAMRVVAAGDATGPNLGNSAWNSGGVAAPIGRGTGRYSVG